MKAPKDKRTKAYKDWKANFDKENTTGLGDVVESITKATGIKKIVDTVFDKAGKDCGCDKRKEKLNKIRMRFSAVRCMTKEQYDWMTEFNELNPPTIDRNQIKEIRNIYLQIFARDIGRPSCCVEPYINDINRIYETYQN